jgi:hypothetical protein
VREYQEHATSELERSDELISRKGTALSQVCQSGSLSSCRDAEASLCLLSNRQYVWRCATSATWTIIAVKLGTVKAATIL